MAYGRMDVFWPDGSFQSFPLSEGNVSVGRSPSATITLDTETISRYHFSINHAEGQVMLADMESANGTYIDGVKLASGEQRELGGGEEVTIGHLRIIYHHMDEMDTQPVGSRYAETTERIELTQPSFRIAAQPPPSRSRRGHTSRRI